MKQPEISFGNINDNLVIKDKLKKSSFRFRLGSEVIICFCSPSPLNIKGLSVDEFREKLWVDIKELVVDAIDDRALPKIELFRTRHHAAGKISPLLKEILEIAKLYDRGKFESGRRIKEIIFLSKEFPEKSNAEIVRDAILWIADKTYILQDYYPDEYEEDRDRFEGMEYSGYDGPYY